MSSNNEVLKGAWEIRLNKGMANFINWNSFTVIHGNNREIGKSVISDKYQPTLKEREKGKGGGGVATPPPPPPPPHTHTHTQPPRSAPAWLLAKLIR